ncbi:spore germination protein [Alicyclobacillus tolerans]|uniref:spore germination protein n=1 Tax=Alicyclobacillus tolerans TaxID=90970 RepID=UPI001F432F4E|nr:spore germination protein [Alicyclobacillus tolerans]MCF8567573.1 spore germination protein [Alicyclobacillus tolerans]
MKRKATWLQFRANAKANPLRTRIEDDSFLNDPIQGVAKLPSELNQLVALVQEKWENCADVQYQHLLVERVPICVVFINGLIDQDSAQRGLMESLTRYQGENVTVEALRNALMTMITETTAQISSVFRAVADGKAVVLVDGQSEALVVDINKLPGRGIETSQNEPTIQGPQEAFIESLQTNLALMRKRLRTPKLKVQTMRVGAETGTQLAMVYLEGIVKPTLVDEAKKRLNRIQIDGVTAANQVREMIADAPWSPFRLTEVTERPDRAIAGLLQGRMCLLIDGDPAAISIPAVFVNGLISGEDYYGHFMVSVPLRLLRHAMYWMSLLLPSLYIALLSYNQDLVPTPLLISLEAQHEGIPFPTVIEALGMQTAFEALREAGLRLPRAIGQSVSIVGALVIGDAAVNANIVSPGMVIIVAAAGVASYTIPSQDLVNANRILQYPFMIAASLLGLYGIVALGLMMVIHMVSLRSFGVPYMAPLAPFYSGEMRDTFVRAPWWAMNRRPQLYEPVDSTRNRTPKPSPPSEGSS